MQYLNKSMIYFIDEYWYSIHHFNLNYAQCLLRSVYVLLVLQLQVNWRHYSYENILRTYALLNKGNFKRFDY